jgi:dTDP-glucose 4,6-dehydratase
MTCADADDPSMSTVLVTGGAGFIGANLVNYLLAHTSDDILVVDKMTYAANPRTADAWVGEPRVTFARADIADRPTIDQLFRRHRPVRVFNLAAETHVDRSIENPDDFIRTNVAGTLVMLDASRRHVRTLERPWSEQFRFLHVSTDEVYGSLGPTGKFSETTPYAPNSPYAASKAAADHLVRSYVHTYGLPAVVTNCSNNYGPYQHPEKLIPLTILNALDGRALPIYGDGTNVRDWLHVEDHCAALLAVIQRGRPGEHYNVGADNEQPNLAIVDTICDVLDRLHPVAGNERLQGRRISRYGQLKTFVPDRPGHDRRYAIDASKLRQELGWAPARSFGEGLTETVEWYLRSRSWYAAEAIGYDRERLGVLNDAHTATDEPRSQVGR